MLPKEGRYFMRQLDMSSYSLLLKRHYLRSNRKGNSLILDEFCQTSGRHRKDII